MEMLLFQTADESASGSDGGQSTDGASVPVSSVVGEDTMSISLQLSVEYVHDN